MIRLVIIVYKKLERVGSLGGYRQSSCPLVKFTILIFIPNMAVIDTEIHRY